MSTNHRGSHGELLSSGELWRQPPLHSAGFQLGPQHLQRVRGGNPETLHGERSVRCVGHVFSGQLEVRGGSRAFSDLTLRWQSFSDAANQAGLSRRYGGIHFEQADLEARAAGRRVAELAWARAQHYINGD